MEQQIIVVVVGIIITAIAAFKVGGMTRYNFKDALETFTDAARLVETYAPAADQLVKIGELQPEDRKDYVIAMVLSHLRNIDIDQVEGILEAWVAEQKAAQTGAE